MNGLRLHALVQSGDRDEVLAEIERVWGGMLDRGPGTFWEEATLAGDPFAMYGRPFGRSLCHAWSAGPAAIIPEAVLGILPLDDGWSSFTVEPSLAHLDWAALVVPAALGDIVVSADRDAVEVDVPPGAALVHPGGDRVEGPSRVRWAYGAREGAPSDVRVTGGA
ncbi:hypothetical protein G5T42_08305 [Microbacterium sp. 4R-513]|uniref:hypothetical protein n=1 Tax=Microbacterium sp. 4R-513 TaxID=2567934 RepID=UPI0013E1C02E|nr:hypothetical protein [Microbacterium sp. 4R-513]QIG39486.1 hypothetical protein G5T42_08305 [Microbacterium sp. 4R-513]